VLTDFKAEDMNYTIVINGALWGGALLYYLLYARKFYKGPQATVGQSSSTPSETDLGGMDGEKGTN
jgi:hypothetical protein